VALGRAIVRQPKVFLLDEPLSNLDAKLRTQMRAEIIKLYRSLGTTFIYVTHDQTEAMTMATRIVVMNDGIIQQVGSPREIYHNPANMFVAGFMGSPQMNFFEKSILTINDGVYCVEMLGKSFVLPGDMQRILVQKRQKPCEVIAGIRPEDIRLSGKGEKDAFAATVEVSEMLGNEVLMHMNAEGYSFVLRVSATDELDGADFDAIQDLSAGVIFNAHKIHLFDAESRKNIFWNT